MRLPILLPLLALGAAPPPANPAAECRLSRVQALAALRRMPVLTTTHDESEHGYSYGTKFDPARLTAFGFPVRTFWASETNAISHRSLTLTITLDAPYAAVRATALRSRGKRDCAVSDGPPDYCEIDQRRAGGWTTAFLLEAPDGQPVLTCLYTRPSR